MKCRICGSEDYKSILNLGSIYPSNFIDDCPDVEPKPLHLVQCQTCNLVQLEETFDLDVMYKDHYWYRSALNPSMVNNLRDIVDKALKIKPDAKVVLDIGCNDGTLLSMYPDYIYKIGVDPSRNIRESAMKQCDSFINDYFYVDDNTNHARYDIITAIAMFYDLENPNKFLDDINKVLADDGILIIQFTDLLSMLKANAFDNICHEHLEYYSLDTLKSLLWSHRLQIFDIEYNNVNGGSIRVYAKRWFYPGQVLDVEKSLRLESDYLKNNPISKFNWTILKEKARLLALIADIKANNESIYVLGASTKGNTLLQHYGLGSTIIDKALEVNQDKFGKKTIGTDIPIISEEDGLKENPNYLLILPWHFKEFIVNKLQPYVDNGMKLIFPLPNVQIIERCNCDK